MAATMQAQTNTPTVEQIAALVQVNVATNGASVTYTVTVPIAANAALSSAKKQGESQEDYTRRAFIYGATGLIQERAALIARRQQILNALNATDSKLK